MSGWISQRIQEASSHQGLIVAAAAAAVIWFAIPLTKVVLWGALAWGVWSMLRKEDKYKG
jgi:hypothetical protein|tara:strand:+ start:134 stop:313 length:180 start_codon:yes stop_codon:yes gene_type:complete